MNFNAFRIGMVLFIIIPQLLSAAVHPVSAAPIGTNRVTASDIDGLDGNPDSDFWSVEYFDTNGAGDANDPKASMASPPVYMNGYGSGAMRVQPGNASGGSGCSGLGGKVFFGTSELAGVKLKDLNAFSYSFLVDATNGSGAADEFGVYVNLFIDRNGDGAWVDGQDSILVYNPIHSLLSIPEDTWLHNNVIGLGAIGDWHLEGQPILGLGLGIPLLDSLLNQIILLPALGLGIDPLALTIGDLKIVNPDSACHGHNGLSLIVGSNNGSNWNDFVAFIDGISLSVGGSSALEVSADLNIIGDPVTATVLSGGNQLVSLNGLLAPIVIELRDANGLLADIGTIATVEVPLLGASALFPSLSLEVLDGSGTVTLLGGIVNNLIGDYIITIVSHLAEVEIDLFNTNAADIITNSGDAQSAKINTAYANPLLVKIEDAEGDPVEGVTVNFSAPSTGASVSFPQGSTADTNSNGIASVNVSANGTIGSFVVVATTAELPADTAQFSLTNLSNANDIAVSAGNNQTATISNVYGSPLVAVVTDLGGSPVAGVTVNFSAPDSGASVSFPQGSSAQTNANGLASVIVTANGQAGMFVVTAMTPDLPSDSAQFMLTNQPVMPGAMDSLAAAQLSATSILLSWDSTTPSPQDTYTLYRSSDGVNFASVATLTLTASTYIDSGLVCGTTYTYRVDVSNSVGTAPGTTATAQTADCQELLVNGNFNTDSISPRRVPTGWKGKGLGRDRQICKPNGRDFDGSCYLSFKPSTVRNGRFLQTLDATGLSAGETLTFSANAWSKKGAKGTIEILVTYADSSRTRHQLKWNQTTAGYTNQTIDYTLISNPTKIVVRIRSRVRRGTWLVDGLSLRVSNAGALRMPGTN